MNKILLFSFLSQFILISCNTMGKENAAIRPAAVAGSFYSDQPAGLQNDLTACFKQVGQRDTIAVTGAPLALIVPHAGYVFSGRVAASAYQCIPENAHYEHIFLLGPSHHVSMEGASVNNAFDYYRTPLGTIPVAKDVCDSLIRGHECFFYDSSAHDKEHCLEVQLPFLQYRLDTIPPIVPIVIGTEDIHLLEQMATALRPYFNEKNLFIISSDFSHYPSYRDASNVDRQTGEAITSKSLGKFVESLERNASCHIKNLLTSACGQSAIAILLMLSEAQPELKMQHVMYENSGDSPYGGQSEVVGYHSFVLSRNPHSGEKDFQLSDRDKRQLLRIARLSIESKSLPAGISEMLKVKAGAFVTLTKQNRLRGCIGQFRYDMPLYQVVEQMSKAAAFEDPRFPAVTAGELGDIRIEISVLTPLKRISSIDEFDYGKQGIYMRKGYRSGTFLPQVADETDWTKEEFLGHCAQDKAGIGWNGWKDAELYTYEAIVFKE